MFGIIVWYSSTDPSPQTSQPHLWLLMRVLLTDPEKWIVWNLFWLWKTWQLLQNIIQYDHFQTINVLKHCLWVSLFLTYLVLEKCEPDKVATTGYAMSRVGLIHWLIFVTTNLGCYNVMWVYKSLDSINGFFCTLRKFRQFQTLICYTF